jgi:hypothetical protein
MNYKLLGSMPDDIIQFFYNELIKRKKHGIPYQWIHFDTVLNDRFLEIFENTELKIQWNHQLKPAQPIQKAFYSDPGHGFRIHKDGLRCKSALNIAISCNDDDWVRWYDTEYIDSIGSMTTVNKLTAKSRNIDIMDYESIPFIEERRNKIGDVYIVNTDVYHSFKCNGPNPRIIIQTKFENFPDFNTLRESLGESSFCNLISH